MLWEYLEDEVLERKINIAGCRSDFFDYAEVKEFCYDKDINAIAKMLDSLVEKCGFSSVKSWSSYREVPELGDCMVYDIRYDCLPAWFMKELVKCKLKTKLAQIDLAIYPNQIYYSDSLKHMVIYSGFLDMERRVRRNYDDRRQIAECIA